MMIRAAAGASISGGGSRAASGVARLLGRQAEAEVLGVVPREPSLIPVSIRLVAAEVAYAGDRLLSTLDVRRGTARGGGGGCLT